MQLKKRQYRISALMVLEVILACYTILCFSALLAMLLLGGINVSIISSISIYLTLLFSLSVLCALAYLLPMGMRSSFARFQIWPQTPMAFFIRSQSIILWLLALGLLYAVFTASIPRAGRYWQIWGLLLIVAIMGGGYFTWKYPFLRFNHNSLEHSEND